MGRKAGFRKPRLMHWFRGWIPVQSSVPSSAQLSPDSRPGDVRQWHCSVGRYQQPHCQHAGPVLGQGATLWKDLSPIRHPWFTLLTALLSLSGVCLGNVSWHKSKLECRRQFYERLWISLHPVESSCWTGEMGEEKGAEEGSCYGLTTVPHSPCPWRRESRGVGSEGLILGRRQRVGGRCFCYCFLPSWPIFNLQQCTFNFVPNLVSFASDKDWSLSHPMSFPSRFLPYAVPKWSERATGWGLAASQGQLTPLTVN